MAKCLNSASEKYFLDQLMAAYFYFSIPRNPNTLKPLFTKLDLQIIHPSKARHIESSSDKGDSLLYPTSVVDVDSKADNVTIYPISLPFSFYFRFSIFVFMHFVITPFL